MALTMTFKLILSFFMLVSVLFAYMIISPPSSLTPGQLHETAQSGFWGPTTGNIEWCEKNYAVTYYVAEFWNSLTSLTIVYVGAVGVHTTRADNAPGAYIFGYAVLIVVGLGSTAFHTTMRREEQTLDEVPMLFLVAAMLHLSLSARVVANQMMAPKSVKQRHKHDHVRFKSRLALCLTSVCAGVCALMFVYPDNPIIFNFSFGFTVFLLVIFSLSRYFYGGSSGRPVPMAQRIGEYALLTYSVGGFFWCVEPHVCEHVQPLQLHAWWHIAAGLATHLSLQFFWRLELDATRNPNIPALQSTMYLPFIRHKLKLDNV